MGLSRTSDASVEPVSRAEAKLQCRYEETDEDDRIDSYIKAARQYAEMYTGKAFINQTWVWKMDKFPSGSLFVPHPPLSSVTSVAYVDTSGVAQTAATSVYGVDTYSKPGRIFLKYNQSWPDTYDQPDSITITYVAGYGAAATSVPETIRQAVLMLVGHWFENREDVIVGVNALPVPRAVDDLLWGERIVGFA